MSTSSEPPGFAIRSVLGTGPRGTVYVATQTSLGRDVALKFYSAHGRTGSWPEHPGVARLHAAGKTDRGEFTASQLAPGGSLARRLAAGDIAREDALALCRAAEETLADLGVAHGALGPGNVLIDATGGALLCDFGMPGVQPSAAADRAALEALRARCAELPSRRARRRRRAARLGAAGLGIVAAGVAAGLALDGDEDTEPGLRPLAGATSVGSSLAGPAPATLGCDGLPPSGSAPSCTVAQLRRDGRPAAVPADGVVRRWAVRGATGVLSLQLVRPLRGRRYVVAAGSQRETVAGTGVHAFAADLAVRRGDLVAVGLLPQAGVGTTRGARSATVQFAGSLRYMPRRPSAATGSDLDAGIELRVDYIPGGRPRPVPTLTGEAARAAPAGRGLADSQLEFSRGRIRTVAVVVAGRRVAVDLLDGARRLMRLEVVGADPRGELKTFQVLYPPLDLAHVSWRNPDGREVTHHYRARVDRLDPVD